MAVRSGTPRDAGLHDLDDDQDYQSSDEPRRLAQDPGDGIAVDHTAEDDTQQDQLAVAAVSAVCESTKVRASC